MTAFCKNNHPLTADARNMSNQCRECKREAAQRYRDRDDALVRAIATLTVSAEVPSCRAVARHLGFTEDRSIRKAWDRLALEGRVPERPKKEREEPAPARSRVRARNAVNGKTPGQRASELRREDAAYLGIVRLQAQIAKDSAILAGFSPSDLGLDEATLDKVSDLLEDLVGLEQWTSRASMAVTHWLGDHDVRSKIEKLRDDSGRTTAEAETARRLADKLERRLNARLTA
jgi:hypothetical protein